MIHYVNESNIKDDTSSIRFIIRSHLQHKKNVELNKMSKSSDSCCDIKLTECYDRELYQASVERQKTKVSATATSAYYPLKDAVVSIYTYTRTTDTSIPVVEEVGSGWFIDSGAIVTAAHVVMFDNTLLTRSPPVVNINATQFARAGEIWARVSNVNRTGDSYFYECDLCAVAPQYDLALLRIKGKQRNACVPTLKNHPVLGWGCSRKYAVGEPVYVIGDDLNMAATGISQGIVVDNLYTDPSLNPTRPFGFWPFEAVVSDVQARYGNSGGPLIDANWRVVGVISGLDMSSSDIGSSNTLPGTGQYIPPASWPTGIIVNGMSVRTVAVAEYVARYIIKVMLDGPSSPCTGEFLEYIQDPLGNFYRYKHGWLGLTGYEIFGPSYLRLVPDSYYQRQKGFIITAVDPTGPAAGLFQNLYPFPIPGDGPAPTPSSELYLVTAITAEGGCEKMVPLGTDSGQIPFSSATFDKIPTNAVTISYRLGSEGFKCPYAATIVLDAVPLNMDIPPDHRQTVSSLLAATGPMTHPLSRGFRDDTEAFLRKLVSMGPDVLKVLRSLLRNRLAIEALSKLSGTDLSAGASVANIVLDKADDVVEAVAPSLPAGEVSDYVQKIDAALE
jgi:S1-C subfamily serine protease